MDFLKFHSGAPSLNQVVLTSYLDRECWLDTCEFNNLKSWKTWTSWFGRTKRSSKICKYSKKFLKILKSFPTEDLKKNNQKTHNSLLPKKITKKEMIKTLFFSSLSLNISIYKNMVILWVKQVIHNAFYVPKRTAWLYICKGH